jgi:hypothetical protein
MALVQKRLNKITKRIVSSHLALSSWLLPSIH